MIKASLAACFVLALGAATAAAGNSAPTTPATTPAAPASTPPAPSPAALAYSATILNDVGMKPSLDRMVPGMLAEVQREILATRPDLKDPLAEAVQTIAPEFLKTEQELLDAATKDLAFQMTEQELKDVAAFYESPTGKKFQTAQLAVANRVATVAAAWRQQMSTGMLNRVHEELKKKGKDF
ncbi:MAG: DUF2059 domain-containing protein [Roseiarcus sp.]|jgi:hypothetical protein